MKELLKYLETLERETNEQAGEIPEEFENLEDSENYNYFCGVLETIAKIKEFIKDKEEIYYSLTAILLQEFEENALIDLDGLAYKYTMNKKQKTALKELYNEYFGE